MKLKKILLLSIFKYEYYKHIQLENNCSISKNDCNKLTVFLR